MSPSSLTITFFVYFSKSECVCFISKQQLRFYVGKTTASFLVPYSVMQIMRLCKQEHHPQWFELLLRAFSVSKQYQGLHSNNINFHKNPLPNVFLLSDDNMSFIPNNNHNLQLLQR